MNFFENWISNLYDNLGKPESPAEILKLSHGVSYWRGYLLERVIRIFEWTGLPMPQKVVEGAVLLTGFAGFADDKRAGLVCIPGSLSGPTPYPMVFNNFTYAAPTCAGGTLPIYPTRPFGSCVIISNDEMRIGVAGLLDRYAVMLAHADTTIGCSLVNARYDSFFRGDDDATVANLKKWRGDVIEGDVLPIVDQNFSSAPTVVPGSANEKGKVVLDVLDARKEILRMFYAEIGIRVMPEKRGNLITAEVSENDQALLFNIGDMLRCRQEAAENINKLFGLSVSVNLSPEFDRITGENDFDGDN